MEIATPVDPAVLEAAEEMLAEENAAESAAEPAAKPVAAVNPFVLLEEREFKQEPPSPSPPQVTVPMLQEAFATVLKHPDVVVPAPGAAASLYRRCPCLAVMPGRSCPRCYDTRWVKLCARCEGTGRMDRSTRSGADRSEVCGGCMGTGQRPASMAEIKLAELTATAAAANPFSSLDPAAPPEFRRAVRLPGIGVTEKKRKGKVKPRRKPGQRIVFGKGQ